MLAVNQSNDICLTALKTAPVGCHDDNWRHNDVIVASIAGPYQLQSWRGRHMLRQQ